MSLLKYNFSIIALSETWLKENSTEHYKWSGYSSVHYVRKNRIGGGGSLFIQDNSVFKVRDDLCLKSDSVMAESVFVELLGVSGCRNVIVGVLYHLPDSVINDFNNSLSKLLDLIYKEDKLCYLLGDFLNIFNSKLDANVWVFLKCSSF